MINRTLACGVALLVVNGALGQSSASPASPSVPVQQTDGSTERVPPRVTAPDRQDDPRFGLLTPLPAKGNLPPIVAVLHGPSERELAARARARRYERQLETIRRKHFGRIRVDAIRSAGVRKLHEFSDPAAFRPMLEVMDDEKDDVRLAVLDHLEAHDEMGQTVLAWAAIHMDDDALRHEAALRLTAPAAPGVLHVLDTALRSDVNAVANNAGSLAGALDARETIPILMHSQAILGPRTDQVGDLAWIAIQTQQAFVAGLEPIAGDSSAAFQPVVGVINEGVVLRVSDAFVTVFRTEVHQSLVAMTTRAWGRSTEHLGYDPRVWTKWYNEEFVPHQNERASQTTSP